MKLQSAVWIILLKKFLTLTFFERQMTFIKNFLKTSRPKTFSHLRFEFGKKVTASFSGSHLRKCMWLQVHVITARGGEYYAIEI